MPLAGTLIRPYLGGCHMNSKKLNKLSKKGNQNLSLKVLVEFLGHIHSLKRQIIASKRVTVALEQEYNQYIALVIEMLKFYGIELSETKYKSKHFFDVILNLLRSFARNILGITLNIAIILCWRMPQS
jgi:uncharacterized membrane protein YjfL (UPF0719 family)